MLAHIARRSCAVVPCLPRIFHKRSTALLAPISTSTHHLQHSRKDLTPICSASKPISIADLGKESESRKSRTSESRRSTKASSPADSSSKSTNTVRSHRRSRPAISDNAPPPPRESAAQFDGLLLREIGKRGDAAGGELRVGPRGHDGTQEEDCSAEERAYQRAKNHAIWLLDRRPFSVQVMFEKLSEKHAPEAAQRAVARLQEVGLLSNAAYAEVFVRSKWNQKLHAPKLIRQDLLREGVDASDIDAALMSIFGPNLDITPVEPWDLRSGGEGVAEEELPEGEDFDEGGDRNYKNWSRLTHACETHLNASRRQPVQTQRRRLTNWLLRRGYTWGVINALCKEVVDAKEN